MSGLAKFFRGLAQACEGLAEACGGTTPAAAAPASSETRTFIEDILKRAAGLAGVTEAPPAEAPPEAPVLGDAHIHGPPGTQGAPAPAAADRVPVAGGVVDGVVLNACQELERQVREKGRRQKLAEDPVNAMHVADYYVLNLCSHPLDAENWTRSIEAIPGRQDARVHLARKRGLPDLTAYATAWDDIQSGLAKAEQIAEAMAAQDGVDATQLLDPDRVGRIRFWLGDRPQEIDINAPAFQPRAEHTAVRPELPHGLLLEPQDGAPETVAVGRDPFGHPVERAAAPGAPAIASP